jgi:hypothetical protein
MNCFMILSLLSKQHHSDYELFHDPVFTKKTTPLGL